MLHIYKNNKRIKLFRIKKGENRLIVTRKWWAYLDSNQDSDDYESYALTVML